MILLKELPKKKRLLQYKGKRVFSQGIALRKRNKHCACQAIEHARLYATSSDFLDPGERNAVETLSKRVAVTQPACDCHAYGLLAAGHCDLVRESPLKPYDYLPIVPIIEGAAGWLADWKGIRSV